jgi:hypothetical protein
VTHSAESVAPLTQAQANVLTAYTGILLGDIAEFQRYAEVLLGRPIMTHEFADKATWVELKEASRDTLFAMCRPLLNDSFGGGE